jgi:hypothetical protein
VPVQLGGVSVHSDATMVDGTGHGIGLTGDSDLWLLLALTGGHPTDVFAELEGQLVRPLAAVVDGELVAL